MASLIQSIPSTSSVFAMYSTFTALAMLIRTILNEVQAMFNQLIPQSLHHKITSNLETLFGKFSSQLTLVINEYRGYSRNEIYQASELYLSTKITPSITQLQVSRVPPEKNISVTIDKGQKVVDTFEGIRLQWEFVSTESHQTVVDYESFSQSSEKSEHKSVLLSFHKKHKEKVLTSYLPYVVERSKGIQDDNKVIKLYSLGNTGGEVNLGHPSTFETLAMDPSLKKELMDDLDRFLKRRDFYRRVGKAWKRGYLLYGPPGTGKSSLIAAMANYLKFDVYDLELSSLYGNYDLRRLLTTTTNRSILVIEDIDCSIQLQHRQFGDDSEGKNKLTLSGLLNFIDGLWSSCGDERIIVFTTNYKDRLDPALLRPGRMDMHIHMSYCNPSMFHILASNYLKIKSHSLFEEIENLMKEVEVSPAEVAEELMRSEDVDTALEGLVGFLKGKKEMKCEELECQGGGGEEMNEVTEEGRVNREKEEKSCMKKNVKKNKKNKGRKGRRAQPVCL